MDLDVVEVHKHAKKERGQYPAILTEQAWSIKDLLYGFLRNVSCGMRRVVPSGQDSSILPALVANHRAGFGSSCHIIKLGIGKVLISSAYGPRQSQGHKLRPASLIEDASRDIFLAGHGRLSQAGKIAPSYPLAHHSTRFGSSKLPTHGADHIISQIIIWLAP